MESVGGSGLDQKLVIEVTPVLPRLRLDSGQQGAAEFRSVQPTRQLVARPVATDDFGVQRVSGSRQLRDDCLIGPGSGELPRDRPHVDRLAASARDLAKCGGGRRSAVAQRVGCVRVPREQPAAVGIPRALT